jgi:nucleoside-diphosphate-sugar epimerase
MHTLIRSIAKRRFLFVGKGENIKSIAYVENIVDATLFLLKQMKPGLVIYNYADYPEMTIEETVKTIRACLGYGAPRFRVPLGPAIAGASMFDLMGKLTGYNFPITAYRIRKFNTATRFKADKIRRTGFTQRVPLKEGFRKMIEWYLKNGNKKGYQMSGEV